jgi:hypothetical protein
MEVDEMGAMGSAMCACRIRVSRPRGYVTKASHGGVSARSWTADEEERLIAVHLETARGHKSQRIWGIGVMFSAATNTSTSRRLVG